MEEALATGRGYRVNHKVRGDASRQLSQTLHSGRVGGDTTRGHDSYLKVLTRTDPPPTFTDSEKQ